jgi:hypothetical protein
MLVAYDWEFVQQAKELRATQWPKSLKKPSTPTQRFRLRALDMLGRVTEVALFTDRVEVKKTDLTDAEIEAKIKDKISRFMGVTDVIDVASLEDVE